MFREENESVSDNELWAYAITRGRTYTAFTSFGSTDLGNALHYARLALQEAHEFDEDATQLELLGCIVLVLFRGYDEFVMIFYPDERVSVALIDVQLEPYMTNIVKLLNTGTLSLWEPLELTTNLVAAFLVAFMDGSLEARLKTVSNSNSKCRTKVEIRNHFVDNALVDVARDNHLTEGIKLVEETIVALLARLKWQLGRCESLKVRDRLKVTDSGCLRAAEGENLLDITKYISHAIKVSLTSPLPKAVCGKA
ncbi:hypothetical protein BIW11_13534 [Tropilaelaps mercedesae]|uniref:Uncharacterized protein n=1 Tax=Tropilaelaps mercedesae TaxID=418985 RepID=A0A1V9X1Z9_9ACAR|nr:hypothetical protein BIW11_13534 [Tropilaelaps mercedesae]